MNNRVTSISGPSLNTSMRYYGDGKLGELDSGGASHRYLVDPTIHGNRILAELDASGSAQVAYVFGPLGLVSQILNGQTYSYLYNAQGSTIAVLDIAGSLMNTYRYDPFGQKLSSSTEKVSNAFAFLGSFSVPSTGQYSITAHRLFDARTGRFTGPDPTAFAQSGSPSAFVYAGQNPLSAVDPGGLWPINLSDLGSQLTDALKASLTSIPLGLVKQSAEDAAQAGVQSLIKYGTDPSYLTGSLKGGATWVVSSGKNLVFGVGGVVVGILVDYTATGAIQYVNSKGETVPIGDSPVLFTAPVIGSVTTDDIPILKYYTVATPTTGETILPNGDCYVGTSYCGNVNALKPPATSSSTQAQGKGK